MAVLSSALVLWMSVIVILRVAARIEYIAVGVMIPLIERRTVVQQFADDIIAGIQVGDEYYLVYLFCFLMDILSLYDEQVPKVQDIYPNI